MKTTVKFFVVITLLLTSCSDALIEDHIEGSWELQTYLRNDVDETSEVKIINYQENYVLDGTFSRSYIDGNQEPVDESGTYSINEDNSTLDISGVSSISEFSDANSTLSTSTVEVIIVDETEFAYSFENGGDNHEFRFTRKE